MFVDAEEAGLFCAPGRRELDMLFYFDHLQVDRRVERYIKKPFSAKRLLTVLAKWQTSLDWNALYLENHDQPRIVSHYGDDRRYWDKSAKLLATLELTLRGTPFIYQGQEIGMTNAGFRSLADFQRRGEQKHRQADAFAGDSRVPALAVDQAVVARQRPHAGAVDGGGGRGLYHGQALAADQRELPNHQLCGAGRGHENSVLGYYRKLIALRGGSDTLKYGAFVPLYANRRVMAYRREGDGEALTVALNFSRRNARVKYRGTVAGGQLRRGAF